jgi:hypothetical protein
MGVVMQFPRLDEATVIPLIALLISGDESMSVARQREDFGLPMRVRRLDALDRDEALFAKLSDLVVKRSELVADVVGVDRSKRPDGPQQLDVVFVQSIVVTAVANVVTLVAKAVKTWVWPWARVAPALISRPLAAVISTVADIVAIVPSITGHGSLPWERVREILEERNAESVLGGTQTAGLLPLRGKPAQRLEPGRRHECRERPACGDAGSYDVRLAPASRGRQVRSIVAGLVGRTVTPRS